LASIVLLTYRQEAFVEEALRSLLKQDWPNFEIIISDDASPDGTLDVVRRTLASAPTRVPVRILSSESNLGVAANWNRAVSEALGEVIIAAAGDDTSDLERVRRAMELFASDSYCQALYFDCRTMDVNGKILQNSRYPLHQVQRRSLDAANLWKGFYFNGATAAYRTSLLRLFGPIDPRCGTEDVSGVVRAQMLGSAVVYPEVLVSWRRHSASLSFRSSSGSAGRLSKLRRARGAYRDAQQIRKDILRSVELSIRTAVKVKGALREVTLMYHQNRIKYHLLHPRRRALVVISMIARLLAEAQIPFPTRVVLAVKRLCGLLLYRSVSA
jgi:glycosyltransferase involved in cell wall biosynthesis